MEINDYENVRGSRQTSVFLPNNLWLLAKQNLIELKQAMIFGIRFKLAEKGLDDYPQNSLSKKILNLTAILKEKCLEIEKLQKKDINPKLEAEAIKEADEYFSDLGGLIDGKPKE